MPCFPSLSDLPEPPDAVVVAIPAAGVAAVVEEAGAIGCGGAVVYGAGFGEIAKGAGARARARRRPRAATACPSAAPTATASWPLHERVALWGDALRPLEPGRVALVSQSGNVAVNTLATRRGLRLHTVDLVRQLGGARPGRLDRASSPARRAWARSPCTWRPTATAPGSATRWPNAPSAAWGVRAQGRLLARGRARGGGAHRRRGRRPARVPRARGGGRRRLGGGRARAARAGEGAGRARAARPATAGAAASAVLTCSGGDSALAADYCARNGLDLPALAPRDRPRGSASCCPTPPRSATRSTTPP